MFPTRCTLRAIRRPDGGPRNTIIRLRHVARISETFQPSFVAPINLDKNMKRDPALSKSQKLLMETGMVALASAPGTFNLLPLFVRSLEKLTKLIDEEMRAIRCQKISMPSLHDAAIWKSTGRWDLMGSEMLKFKDRLDRECCLGPTHEEVVTALLASTMHSASYKKFPVRIYQISPKFRDEMKPKHGLLRAREFLMKDLYTFDATEENAKIGYDAVIGAYENILRKLELPFIKAEASSGSMGGTLSHEFLLPCDSVGEDSLQVCPDCGAASNEELVKDDSTCHSGCSKCSKDGIGMTKVKAIEVAHSFLLGTQYAKKLGANFTGPDGRLQPLVMGCYGIGVTRLLAACVEVLSTEDRIRWPIAVAPYGICVIPPKAGSKEAHAAGSLAAQAAERLDQIPQGAGEVIMDDRDELTIGRRLKDAQKTGYPIIVVVGKAAAEPIPKLEIHFRESDEEKSLVLPLDDLLSLFGGHALPDNAIKTEKDA